MGRAHLVVMPLLPLLPRGRTVISSGSGGRFYAHYVIRTSHLSHHPHFSRTRLPDDLLFLRFFHFRTRSHFSRFLHFASVCPTT